MTRQATSAQPLWVADISLWGIATLYTLDRITLDRPLQAWLEAATAPSLVQRVGISPAMAAAVTVLPTWFHRDPADRILVPTAQVFRCYSMIHLSPCRCLRPKARAGKSVVYSM